MKPPEIIDLETIHEVDGDWTGKMMGCYCDGHVDHLLFYESAKYYYCGEWTDSKDVPFNVNQVKHQLYRLPTEEEVEEEGLNERQLIIGGQQTQENSMKPITLVYWE